MKHLAPIILFVYNRLEHTQQTLEALRNNILTEHSTLFIYSDGPKNVEHAAKVIAVRQLLENVTGFAKVIVVKREGNWGLANNIIDGVTKIVNEFGRVIVLEDDLVTSPYFLQYMNDALDMYENEPQVASIHGYCYPFQITSSPETFFLRDEGSWGWATWARAWKFFETNGKELLYRIQEQNLISKFDCNNSFPYFKMLQDQIDRKNNSWAIRWRASIFLNNMLTLYPGRSLVKNIGFDNTGTHCNTTNNSYDVELSSSPIKLIYQFPIENKSMRAAINAYLLSASGYKSKSMWARLAKSFRKRIDKLKKFLIFYRLSFNDKKHF
ncbi:MAG: hypothetical protein K0S74_941 [Chlamydiales bacterium]|jgi:GT2 family glycosyltransferase|nr:hypothetical protein [Chlamydiales bacterium]